MSDKNLAKFKRLVKQGCTPEEVMEKMNISRRTYFNYKKRAEQNNRRKSINPQEYYSILIHGIKDRAELCERLGMTAKTVIKHEKEGDFLKRVSRGIFVQGLTQILPAMLHITPQKAKEYTNGMPTLKGVEKSLKIIIDTLTDFSEFDPTAKDKVRVLERVLSEIELLKYKTIAEL